MKIILVTGGAGFIGSHTCVELIAAGYQVVVYDNFNNSHPEALSRIEKITGKSLIAIKGDICNQALLEQTIRQYKCDSVIHFAGLKAVGESVNNPLYYYENNVAGTLSLLRAMENSGIYRLVFSSSATVYGNPQQLPIKEDHSLSPKSPYGRTKLFIEEILRDIYSAEPNWRIGILRYFNPVGAHESGLIGEDPLGTPNNLMPFIAQVAIGRLDTLNIWGSDYDTHDGTGVRDYIHVVDLAIGHLRALEKLDTPQCFTLNLGTGKGYSVVDVLNSFEESSNRKINHIYSPRRPGDIASCYADTSLAKETLNWTAKRTLDDMCRDTWNWQKMNPTGYL